MKKENLIAKINKPLWFRTFLFYSLPAAFFSGLRIQLVDEHEATVVMRYIWFSKNPFRSIYFACLAMAAEMSSGILALVHTGDKQPRVSMLVLGMRSSFHKKAVGRIRFVCTEGDRIQAAIDEAVQTGNGTTVEAYSKGLDENDTCIAEFWITWTFKQTRKN